MAAKENGNKSNSYLISFHLNHCLFILNYTTVIEYWLIVAPRNQTPILIPSL